MEACKISLEFLTSHLQPPIRTRIIVRDHTDILLQHGLIRPKIEELGPEGVYQVITMLRRLLEALHSVKSKGSRRRSLQVLSSYQEEEEEDGELDSFPTRYPVVEFNHWRATSSYYPVSLLDQCPDPARLVRELVGVIHTLLEWMEKKQQQPTGTIQQQPLRLLPWCEEAKEEPELFQEEPISEPSSSPSSIPSPLRHDSTLKREEEEPSEEQKESLREKEEPEEPLRSPLLLESAYEHQQSLLCQKYAEGALSAHDVTVFSQAMGIPTPDLPVRHGGGHERGKSLKRARQEEEEEEVGRGEQRENPIMID